MKTLFYNIVKVTLVIILAAACSKDVLDENPPNILAGQTIFKDLAGFESGLNGVYNIARHGRWQSEKIENALNGVDNMCSNYRRSEIYYTWGPTNSPADDDLLETFQWLYEIVNGANTIIFYAQGEDVNWTGGSDTPEGNKNRVIADARALRAWAYKRLTYSWGDVPLSLGMETQVKTDWERTPILEVRKQAIRDYIFAQQYIPTEASKQGRMTKGAVQTLLAEMYLTIGKPDSALYWADQAISNPAYQLITERYGVKINDPTGSPFGDMFKEGNQNREDGNTEALWVWQFELASVDQQGSEYSRALTSNYNQWNINGKRALQYTAERGGRGKSYFTPTKWWIDSYEEQDDRAQNYILRTSFTINNAAANAPYPADLLPTGYQYGDTVWCNWSQPITSTYRSKPDWPYSRKSESCDPTNMAEDFGFYDQIYMRLADTYLLKAEAQFKLGQPDASAATINIIRERSNATPITGA
ncbi:MAG: hypothetical protein H6Q23_1945, partial [Bacteroidetes bacterium]|nr:hypothetical protein [Bacteroidota bacterium]